jgi:DNA-directed RNA polymerase II subunit RPB2
MEDAKKKSIGGYVTTPWTLIGAYFQPDMQARLVRSQIESYDYFVQHQLARTIAMFNDVVVKNTDAKAPRMDVHISFSNFQLNRPQIFENNGASSLMFPNTARLRDFSYSAPMFIDLSVKYVVHDTGLDAEPRVIHKVFPKLHFGKLPVMVKSSLCTLTQYSHLPSSTLGECEHDCGGYFIIRGSEKVVLAQERSLENHVMCHDVSKSTNKSKYSWAAEVRSVPDNKCVSARQVTVSVLSKHTNFGYPIVVQTPRIKSECTIPLFVLFRALGVESDKAICEQIVLDLDDNTMLEHLRAAIIDASAVRTTEQAHQYLANHVTVKYSPHSSREQFAAMKEQAVQTLLATDFLPHCPTVAEKRYFLGHMVRRLLVARYVDHKFDDRDSFINKRVDGTGVSLNNLFRSNMNKLVKDMEKQIAKEIVGGMWRAKGDVGEIIDMRNVYKILKPAIIENGFKRPLASGDFGIRNSKSSKAGVAQLLSRLNANAATLSHLRRISAAGASDKNGKLVAPRKLHSTTWGFICPTETPEGPSVGIIKSLSVMAYLTVPSDSSSIYRYLAPYVAPLSGLTPIATLHATKVMVNGCVTGIAAVGDAFELYLRVKQWKYTGAIHVTTSVVFDIDRRELRVCTDAGRLVRPLLRVSRETGRLLLTSDVVADLRSGVATWDDLCVNGRYPHSCIENVDVEEQCFSLLATHPSELSVAGAPRYTHCEIHPSTILGVLAACIPFIDRNQSPRNTYQSAQGKQAIGTHSTNERLDKTSYELVDPQKPLVDTRFMNTFGLSRISAGANLIVAIMTHTGYNQEDSLLVNQGSVDRGMHNILISHTEKDEDKQTSGTDESRCQPNPDNTRNLKFANYDKLGPNGVVPVNTQINNRDIIMGKVTPIKGSKNDDTQLMKFDDLSLMHTTCEDTVVTNAFVGKNGDGYNMVKVKMSSLRGATIGDKFSSRHGQKGTVGNSIPEADMPYTLDGVRPDIIINPHAIPSRMTIGQLTESALGKVLVELGLFGDATGFSGISADDIARLLVKMGKESHGNELMYSGLTGELLDGTVFVGPTFYQRLKHMVIDKQHSRAFGPMVSMTRQPSEGRSRAGGLRIGEMEKDCTMSHGMSRFTMGRMYYESDKYSVHTCKKCGMIVAYNAAMGVYHCRSCNNRTSFSYVKIPYACKLMLQELTTMSVVPRIVTKE